MKVRNDYIEVVPNNKKVTCNMCGGHLTHYNYNGTFIWMCDECPNIQLEFYNDTDIIEFNEFLKLKI